MSPYSLRLRLLLLAALSIGVTLSVAGISLVYIFERHLEQRVAQELERRLIELASAFTVDGQGAPQVARELSDPRYRQPYSGAYWQVSSPDGGLLRSRSLWDEALDKGGAPAPPEAVERVGPNGSLLYVLERDVTLGSDAAKHSYRLAVALDHAEINALRKSFGRDVARTLVLLGTVLFIGAGAQSVLGLRPLRRLRAELKRIHDGRLARLPGRFPDEVEPLARDLNDLLDRQDELIQRARKRAADLAHGLKTPLTILAAEARSLAEQGRPESALVLHEQIALMRGHIDRELARARIRGASGGNNAITDVPRTVDRLVGLMRRMPQGDRLAWRSTLPPGLRLRMDPDDFGEILGNLVDNARKWARLEVTITSKVEGDRVSLAITDDGPGIPADMRDRLVERGEQGAGATPEGSGLGLAIARDILAEYGAELTISGAAGGSCRVAFAMPGWVEPAVRERAATDPQPARVAPEVASTA